MPKAHYEHIMEKLNLIYSATNIFSLITVSVTWKSLLWDTVT